MNGKKTLILLISIIILTSCGSSTPSDVVLEFCELYGNKEYKKLSNLMTNDAGNQFNRNLANVSTEGDLYYNQTTEVVSEKENGSSFVIRVKITRKVKKSRVKKDEDPTITGIQDFGVMKINGQWKINSVGGFHVQKD